jgi:signal transduction histidine kinase
MYERYGAGYVWLCPVGFVVAYVVGVTLPVAACGFARYEGLSVAQFGVVLLVTEGGALLAVCGAFYLSREDLRVLLGWAAAGRAPATAEQAMRAAHRFPERTAGAAVLASFVTALPAAVASLPIAVGRLRLADAIFMCLGETLVVLYVAVIIWSIMETTLWPLIADVVARSPNANRVQAQSTPLAFRMIASVALVAALGGILLGAFVVKFGAGPGEGLRVIGLSCLVALTLVLLRVVMITLSVLQPVRELIPAARRVGEGDLDVLVPVTSPDELGELAASFNEMVAGLRDRESLRQRIVKVADDERRRLERDLHDGAQQHLVLLGLKLGLAERMIQTDPVAAAAAHAELRESLDLALSALRDLAHGIYPALLETDGLMAALREAAQRAAIPTDIDCDGTGRYARELEAAVYFCCLEALQNAAKHAGDGARATIHLAERDSSLHFAITDNGTGFDTTAAQTSAGLQNMADRIGALGGDLIIDSQPGAGATVTGTIPLRSLPEPR